MTCPSCNHKAPMLFQTKEGHVCFVCKMSASFSSVAFVHPSPKPILRKRKMIRREVEHV